MTLNWTLKWNQNTIFMPIKTTLYDDKDTSLDKNRNLLITIWQKIKGSQGTTGQSDKNTASFPGRPWKQGWTSILFKRRLEILLGASCYWTRGNIQTFRRHEDTAGVVHEESRRSYTSFTKSHTVLIKIYCLALINITLLVRWSNASCYLGLSYEKSFYHVFYSMAHGKLISNSVNWSGSITSSITAFL